MNEMNINNNNITQLNISVFPSSPPYPPPNLAIDKKRKIRFQYQQENPTHHRSYSHRALELPTITNKDITTLHSWKRGYQEWKGRNIILCKGRIIGGSEICQQFKTLFLILIPFTIFSATSGSILLSTKYSWMYWTSILLLISTIICFLITGYMDPGIIPRINDCENAVFNYAADKTKTVKNNWIEFPYEQSINVGGQICHYKLCPTCKVFRGPRGFHCNVCNNCVDNWDHHCPWVGNCVGQRNYKAFMSFLLFTNTLVIWVEFISFYLLYLRWISNEKHSSIDTFLYTINDIKYGTIFALSICICILWIFPIILCLFHCYLIAEGVTTHEKLRNEFQFVSKYSHGCLINCIHFCCKIGIFESNIHIYHKPMDTNGTQAQINKYIVQFVDDQTIREHVQNRNLFICQLYQKSQSKCNTNEQMHVHLENSAYEEQNLLRDEIKHDDESLSDMNEKNRYLFELHSDVINEYAMNIKDNIVEEKEEEEDYGVHKIQDVAIAAAAMHASIPPIIHNEMLLYPNTPIIQPIPIQHSPIRQSHDHIINNPSIRYVLRPQTTRPIKAHHRRKHRYHEQIDSSSAATHSYLFKRPMSDRRLHRYDKYDETEDDNSHHSIVNSIKSADFEYYRYRNMKSEYHPSYGRYMKTVGDGKNRRHKKRKRKRSGSHSNIKHKRKRKKRYRIPQYPTPVIYHKHSMQPIPILHNPTTDGMITHLNSTEMAMMEDMLSPHSLPSNTATSIAIPVSGNTAGNQYFYHPTKYGIIPGNTNVDGVENMYLHQPRMHLFSPELSTMATNSSLFVGNPNYVQQIVHEDEEDDEMFECRTMYEGKQLNKRENSQSKIL